MSSAALKLLTYAYNCYQATGDMHVEYQTKNGNDLVFSTNAIEELAEESYISEVVELPTKFLFRLETIITNFAIDREGAVSRDS